MNNRKKILALRTIHVIGALFLYFCAGFLIYAAKTDYLGTFLYVSLGALSLELFLVTINKFDCPLHPIHKKLGDEKAFFGLFLPVKYTRKAMNISMLFAAISFVFWALS